jgi:hypothetical protein
MYTRRRKGCCVSAALWLSTRPKTTVSGETTCSPSSHVGPHRLTWTFAAVLCQGSGANKVAASIDSFWGARTYPKRTQNSYPTHSCKRRRFNCHQLFVASPRLLVNTKLRYAIRRSTSNNGAPQPSAQKLPVAPGVLQTKSGGSCSSPSAKPKPTGRTSLRICSAVPRIV